MTDSVLWSNIENLWLTQLIPYKDKPMKLGQFMTFTTRKEFPCYVCQTTLPSKSEVYAFRYMKTTQEKRRLWFLHRMHPSCLPLYIIQESEKFLIRRESRKVSGITRGPGRPKSSLSPELQIKRNLMMNRINTAKNNLLWAYFTNKRKSIRNRKSTLSRYILEMIDSDVGELTNFRLNFVNQEKSEQFLSLILSREPGEYITYLQQVTGNARAIAEALLIEGSESAAEYGYIGDRFA